MSSDTYLVCSPKESDTGLFDDNVEGVCSQCGIEVIHRPHVPEDAVLVCLFCALKMFKIEDQVNVTPETVAELRQLGFLPEVH